MDQNQLHYGISLKLYFENKAFGPGMSVLLRGVESTGSLQGAAQAMNMAYSKAWKMLKESEKAWGFMLTERETGGRDGGGSTLTPQAVRLLEAYDASWQRQGRNWTGYLNSTFHRNGWKS